jgi:signal transduction histidine kinase
MGLTIVKNFVENNTGGKIAATARGPLGGASFCIRIPGAKPEEAQT